MENSNPYLHHLIADPTFGYLFAHRLAIAAFGVPNEYHLNKHRPRLLEGQHYIKIRGADHIERLFYTLIGLLTLADLIGTPQAQQFKQALVQSTQPGGEIVSVQPTPLYQPQPTSQTLLYPEPAASMHTDSLLAHYLQLPTEHTTPPAITRIPAPAPLLPMTLQDTAALIFEAQRLTGEHARQTAETLLEAQRLMTHPQPPQIHLTLWKRADNWFATQDTWAMLLIAGSLFALVGLSAYFVVSAAVRQAPPPGSYSTQSLGR